VVTVALLGYSFGRMTEGSKCFRMVKKYDYYFGLPEVGPSHVYDQILGPRDQAVEVDPWSHGGQDIYR
jgi:hypothetical protein